MNNYKIIKDVTTDLERAFYNSKNTTFENCTIAGEQDGESAFKESNDIKVINCNCVLRYPFWHDTNLEIKDTILQDTCRAAIWYSKNISIDNCKLHGIKVIRECIDTTIKNSDIDSKECFWICKNIEIKDTTINSEYPFLNSDTISLKNVTLKGKYSFQYCKNVNIVDSYLDTKDAFWETENVTCINSTIKGEYLAWYAKNLTLINCKIIGTQPLCYCTSLKLIDCEMIDCDLSFEYSEVYASIIGKIESIKNPLKGVIIYEDCGEIIEDENFRNEGIIIKKKTK